MSSIPLRPLGHHIIVLRLHSCKKENRIVEYHNILNQTGLDILSPLLHIGILLVDGVELEICGALTLVQAYSTPKIVICKWAYVTPVKTHTVL